MSTSAATTAGCRPRSAKVGMLGSFMISWGPGGLEWAGPSQFGQSSAGPDGARTVREIPAQCRSPGAGRGRFMSAGLLGPRQAGGRVVALHFLPVLVPGIHLVAAGHGETGRPQVLEALVVIDLGGIPRLGLGKRAGRQAAIDDQGGVAALAAIGELYVEAPAREDGAMHGEVAGPGHLRRGDADIPAGDERQEVTRQHGLAGVLDVHQVVLDLD